MYINYNEVNELRKKSDYKMNSIGYFKILWGKDFEKSFQQFKRKYLVPQPITVQLQRQERIDKIFNEITQTQLLKT